MKLRRDEQGIKRWQFITGACVASRGSKGKAPTGQSAAAKENSQRRIDQLAIDQGRNRFDFNQEIKRLNQQRAAFSPIPLTIQIERMDSLLDSLDGRVKKLKTLSDKTRLPNRLQTAITTLFFRAKVAVVRREQAQVLRDLSATEKQTRKERQQGRYGRAYRIGIQEQMREMRQNITILQTKQTEYKKYHAFVRMLETKVEQFRAAKGFLPPLPLKEEWQQKIATGESVRLKITLEAEKLRMLIPAEYKAQTPKTALAMQFKTSASKGATVDLSEKPIVNIAVGETKTEKPAPVGKIGEQKIVQSTPDIKTAPMPWKIAANEKTLPLLNNIAQELQKIKVATLTESTSKADGLRAVFHDPLITERRTTNEVFIYKVKMEAEPARNKVPLEFRAKPYAPSAEEKQSSINSQSFLQGKMSAIRHDAQSLSTPSSDKKMSYSFNTAAQASSIANSAAGNNLDMKPN